MKNVAVQVFAQSVMERGMFSRKYQTRAHKGPEWLQRMQPPAIQLGKLIISVLPSILNPFFFIFSLWHEISVCLSLIFLFCSHIYFPIQGELEIGKVVGG